MDPATGESQPSTADGAGIVNPQPADTEGEYELSIDEDEDLCATVVLAIAEIQGIDPLEMPPVHDVHDTETVDEMVSMLIASDDVTAGPMTFSFYDHEVTVEQDGHVTIRED